MLLVLPVLEVAVVEVVVDVVVLAEEVVAVPMNQILICLMSKMVLLHPTATLSPCSHRRHLLLLRSPSLAASHPHLLLASWQPPSFSPAATLVVPMPKLVQYTLTKYIRIFLFGVPNQPHVAEEGQDQHEDILQAGDPGDFRQFAASFKCSFVHLYHPVFAVRHKSRLCQRKHLCIYIFRSGPVKDPQLPRQQLGM